MRSSLIHLRGPLWICCNIMMTIYLMCLMHVLCTARSALWNTNAVFNITQTAARSSNLSDCFVCVFGPSSLSQGMPLEADPLRPEAWLTKEVAANNEVRVGTPRPYEFTVAHRATLCYASERGTNDVGTYPQCDVTVSMQGMGVLNGTISSYRNATQCKTERNDTSWHHVLVGTDLWVTNYGALSANASDCSMNRTALLEAMSGTPVGVLLASVQPYDTAKPSVLVRPGWFFLCGNGAFKTLPGNWSGSCTIGTVRPALEVIRHRRRMTRSDNPLVTRSSGWWSFVRVFSPSFGVMELESALVNISVAMERFADHTSHGMSVIQEEIKSISAFTYQNRLALDFLLVKSGGVCVTLNLTCCFLTDKSGELSVDIEGIRKQAAIFHAVGLDSAVSLDAVAQWMKNIFGTGWSGWFMRLFAEIIILCLMFMIVRQCVAQCMLRMCTSVKPPARVPLLLESDCDKDCDKEFHRLEKLHASDEDADSYVSVSGYA